MNNSFYKSERHPNEPRLVNQEKVTDVLDTYEDWKKYLWPSGAGAGRFNCWFLDSNSGKALTGLQNYWKTEVNDYKKRVIALYHEKREERAKDHESVDWPMYKYDPDLPEHERQRPAASKGKTCPPPPRNLTLEGIQGWADCYMPGHLNIEFVIDSHVF